MKKFHDARMLHGKNQNMEVKSLRRLADESIFDVLGKNKKNIGELITPANVEVTHCAPGPKLFHRNNPGAAVCLCMGISKMLS